MNNIEKILKKQNEFFYTGKTIDIEYRKEQLKKLKEAVDRYEEKILYALQLDLGKSEFEAFTTEVGLVKSEIENSIKNLRKWSKPKKIKFSIMNPFSKNTIYNQPYGKCLILSPWNYPFQLAIMPLIGSIAAGNCMVLKLSELSLSTSKIIKEIIEEIFSEEYVAVFLGDGKEAEQLVESDFDFIFYTGNPNIGSIIAKSAGERLIPCVLELGGKSPCIVDETSDIDNAAKKIIWGKLLNSGQTCVAPDYIIVKEEIYNKLIKKLIHYIELFYGKNPIESKDYPKIINKRHFNRIKKLVEKEEIIYGGSFDENILKINPMILKVNNIDSEIMKEEIFGPIIPIVTYEEKTEIYSIIKKNKNPLALYLFTKDLNFEKEIIEKISFGGGCINDTIIHCSSKNLPFGGIGKSGIGSYHEKYSFDTFSHKKTVVKSKKFADMSIKYPPFNNKKFKLIKKVFKWI